MARWFYPLVPHNKYFKYNMNNVYRAQDSVVGKGTKLMEDVLIGQGTVVGGGACLTETTLGRKCKIGNDCVLTNCVLEDGVSLGSGVVLSNCIIGRGAIIPSGVTIGEKVILGEEVELGEGVTVPSGARMISNDEDDWGQDDENNDEMTASSEWGPKAFIYKDDDADDESAASDKDNIDTWGEVYYTEEEDSSDESDDDESEQDFEGFENDSEEETTGGEHDDVKNFRREVIDSIARGLEQGVASDNLVLEINGSKHAWNITLSEVNQCVIYAVLTNGVDTTQPPAALLSAATANIKKFLGLLRKYCSGANKQGYYLAGLETLVARDIAWLEVLPKVLHFLYDKDVLEDAVIIDWMEDDGEDKEVKDKM